jgi:dethiobiotin synthetase
MPILFITGTDTGVGKTFFTAAFVRELARLGAIVTALKPVCSGGRNDARALRAAAGNNLPLDLVNPWFFRAALSPALAARREKRRLKLATVVSHIRKISRRFDITVVEGAGGLLSPLGEGFDSRDLIRALGARVIVVCPNKLGAVGQTRLVMDALPAATRRTTRIVLVNPRRPDAASKTNRAQLAEFFPATRIFQIAWQHPSRLKTALRRSS